MHSDALTRAQAIALSAWLAIGVATLLSALALASLPLLVDARITVAVAALLWIGGIVGQGVAARIDATEVPPERATLI